MTTPGYLYIANALLLNKASFSSDVITKSTILIQDKKLNIKFVHHS